MKAKLIIALALVAAMAGLTACDGQKPSPRNRDLPKEEKTASADSITSLVDYTKARENSTPEITVKLNGVPFNILWDTGAMSTCISSLEFINLVKARAIDDDDQLGTTRATVADGSTVVVPVYNIRELTIPVAGGKELVVNNVTVMVMDDLQASMLLGQNVMKELPRHSFNERTQQIEFYDRK